ncbi:MAG TPA: glycosyltransferase family 39 protein [Candidatus Eisenbacteria bacterium]|nr:glycosyltransferase family 39 protein [Candidatus Eisenbacteria bacterium]
MRLRFSNVHAFNSTTLAVVLLAASLAARLWLAASLGLQKDEAFYAVWARGIHPSYALLPLMALRASCALLGENAFAVRLPFVLAMTAAGAFAFVLARRLGGSGAAGAWTVALLLGNLWAHFVGAQAHPDAFLAMFWIGALAVLARAPADRGTLWLGAALAAGAALSKYTGYLLWPAWVAVACVAPRAEGESRPSLRDLGLASLLWLGLVAPGLLAMAAEKGHWLRVAIHLSDLREQLSLPARLAFLPLAPLLYLFSPGSAVLAIGPVAAWRAGGASRRTLWVGLAAFAVFAALAARGSLKGNWLLPALWGTLPAGVVWFLEGPRRRRWLLGLTAAGIAVTAAAHLAALHPSRLTALARRGPLAAVDSTYLRSISAEERRYATSRRWTDRLGEWRLSAPLADSLARRAALGGPATAVVTDLYEVAYAVRFHFPTTPVRLLGDTRFRLEPEFARGPEELPARFLYVTSRGTNLPEPFFTWYGYLERDRALTVPLGREDERRYEAWRCERSEDGWTAGR